MMLSRYFKGATRSFETSLCIYWSTPRNIAEALKYQYLCQAVYRVTCDASLGINDPLPIQYFLSVYCVFAAQSFRFLPQKVTDPQTNEMRARMLNINFGGAR